MNRPDPYLDLVFGVAILVSLTVVVIVLGLLSIVAAWACVIAAGVGAAQLVAMLIEAMWGFPL